MSRLCVPRPSGVKGGTYCDTPQGMYSKEWWSRNQTSFDFQQLLGLTLVEAEQLAQSHGYSVRPTVLNGRSQIVTQDLRANRINVAISRGIIVEIRGTG